MHTASFGAWNSPITSEHLVKDAVVFQELAHNGKTLYWTQLVPAKKGRVQLALFDEQQNVLDPVPEMSIRTRVHEYGGGALRGCDGAIYFVNSVDGRIYRLEEGGRAIPITPSSSLRLADIAVAPGGTLYAVAEEHREGSEVENKIVSFTKGAPAEVVASGHDFYSSPRISPDGKQLVWITWDHPQMPWDGSNLWLADLSSTGEVGEARMVAGGVEESICNPVWAKTGELYFVSDRSGWWNLYRRTADGKIDSVYKEEADFALPPWVFGRESYGFTESGEIVCIYTREGADHLALLNPSQKTLKRIPLPFTMMRSLVLGSGCAYFHGGSATQPPSLVELDLSTGKHRILKESVSRGLDEEWISIPQTIAFQTRHGDLSYGFYYPPTNPDYQAPKGELPPLIVKSHGGPTGHVQPVFSMETQFWTSRGFAFLDMNYSGSSGYGRLYRKRLEGTWGVRDVEDCLDGALYLAEKGLADSQKLLIRGGSAGGYTTLCALTFYDLFAAGTSYYGVSDLELLAKDTHKFESRYLDRLVAPYPAQKKIYEERSPLQHIDRLSRPLLLLQGSDDPVVPLNQAELVYEALIAKGTPVALLVFKGEQHGFKMAPNIMRAIEAELSFYAQVLKLSLSEEIEPVRVEGLR
ncbi:MAG: S9 family peptidase [Chlamydiales bacterium]|nr:S9 family peptidase [Chlamydiales bacterium]